MPVPTFIVASEDIAILTDSFVYTWYQRPEFSVPPTPEGRGLGMRGVNFPELVLDNFEPLTSISLPPLCLLAHFLGLRVQKC